MLCRVWIDLRFVFQRLNGLPVIRDMISLFSIISLKRIRNENYCEEEYEMIVTYILLLCSGVVDKSYLVKAAFLLRYVNLS